MASILASETRRLYSWWWDSHNTPKNSKWLLENLTDMDDKVKSMIKLIEEDADSFARKAEMYYKKRPELMKMVEEFYRAYRALAERYDYATGELRHAHRTLVKAFPDQVPSELIEDSPESSAQEKEQDMHFLDDLLQHFRGLSSQDMNDAKKSGIHNENLEGGCAKRGLKELSEIEVQCLKKALEDMQIEKDHVLLQYQQCQQKLSKMEEELNNAQEDSARFNENACLAEIELQTLKEALIQLETEKHAGSLKQRYYLDRISDLEGMASQLQENLKGLENRAIESEGQAQNLKDEMSRLELEKEEMFHLYNNCISKLSDLESIVSVKEDEIRLLKKQAERAEADVFELKRTLVDLNQEKEASAQQYQCCLETISSLEKDLASAKDDVKRLNNEVMVGNAKLKTFEGQCTRLELSNQTLRVEADNLAKKIAMKDQELLNKQGELEKLESCLQDEHVRHSNVEATLQNLQHVHSQSQDDQRALALELENVLRMLKDVEASRTVLEEEIHQIQDENHCLNQVNLSSAVSMENIQNEVLSLREIKEKLEKEVSVHMGICNSLQKEIFSLKEEISSLNKNYQALIEQVEAADLNPDCVATSVRSLQAENSRLREICEEGSNEKAIMLKKLEGMEEVLKKKMIVESTLSELSAELESSHEKVNRLQESCQILHGEKSALVGEKATLLSQLQAITENMQRLLEKNAVLENSFSSAKVELEGLREKSKGLEEICELLKNERLYLLAERDSWVSKLKNEEVKLENMEKRYIGLEERYARLQKEKEAMHCHVDKLEVALGLEKQERTSSQERSENRLAGLENQIHLLQEENRWKKKESEEELENSLKAQFELSVLQKFMKDMEEKNYSLIIECQKHVEASKLAERLISELESESLERQVEFELLLDEIERLRLGIYQIFRCLETAPDYAPLGKVENERAFVCHILETIEMMKCRVSENEDEKQQLIVENSVLLTLLQQLESKGMDIVSQKVHLEQEFRVMAEKLVDVRNEKDELQDLNHLLKSEVNYNRQEALVLEAELDTLCAKQVDLQRGYNALQETYSQVNQQNTSLLEKFAGLEEEKRFADKQHDVALLELLASSNQLEALRIFGAEKVAELKVLLEDLDRQHEVNKSLGKEVKALREELDLQHAQGLKDAIRTLENKIQEMRACNVQMNEDLQNSKKKLILTEAKLLDTEMKLEAAEESNSMLSRTVDDLKNELNDSEEIRENLEIDLIHLTRDNHIQKEEIQSLQITNKKLDSELGNLQHEVEENVMRELSLNTELQEMNNEFEVYESEASTFCFDLQVSSIQEVLLKNKVQELTGVCKGLENDRASKILELEEMKEKMCSMENEIIGLKSQLSAYAPVVASLRDEFLDLQKNVLPPNKLKSEIESWEAGAYPGIDSSQTLPGDHSLVSLKELQMRVREVRKMMEETKKQSSSNSSSIEVPSLGKYSGRDKHERSRKKGHANGLNNSPKLQKSKSKVSEARSGLIMKDIPLDHVSDSLQEVTKRGGVGLDDFMFEMWETLEDSNKMQIVQETLDTPSYKQGVLYDEFENVDGTGESEHSFTFPDIEKELRVDCKVDLPPIKAEPNREVSDKRIMERLASDAKKLENLQETLDVLKEKWESNKKSKRAKNVESELVNDKLLEVEDTLIQLMDLNGQLVNHIELCPQDDDMSSPRMKETVQTWRMKVMEQANKGAERIGRLQLELQKLQFNLLKLMDDKKLKGKHRFFQDRSIVLRDFVYNGRKNSTRRRKKSPNFCFKQSTSTRVDGL